MTVASPTSPQNEAQGIRKAFEMFDAECRINWSSRMVLSFSESAVSKMRVNGQDEFSAGFEAGALIVAKSRLRQSVEK